MLYRKTKLFLGLIPIFISFLVSQATVAKLNINPEPTRIELTARLNRCKDQGFIVNKNPSNEKALRELVDTCESNLKIVYPLREDLLVRIENCVQSGYKDEIPNNLTLVDLNDLVDLCEKRSANRSNSSSNNPVFIFFILIAVAFFVGVVLNQSSAREYLLNTQRSHELLLKRQNLTNELLHKVDQMSGTEFEEFLGQLYQGIGWFVELTGKSNDRGCDLIIFTKDRSRFVAIQAKRYKDKKVSYDAVQQIYTARDIYKTKEAWVVTNSYFTTPAQTGAKQLGVTLHDRNYLQELIFEYVSRLKL